MTQDMNVYGKFTDMFKYVIKRADVLRSLFLLFTLMTLGVTNGWAQIDFSGTYYIANDANHAAAIDTRWYLVPGADPHQAHYADAYFSDEYCNKSGKGDYKTTYGDPEKPFLTTYQTNQDLNSIWIISSAGDGSYYIKHAKTGKYIIYEPPYKDAPQRKSMHLESTETPGENAKFTITGSLSGPININPKSVTSGNMYFNPATGVGNRATYYAPSGDYLHDGMIGLWSASNGNSQWYLEKTVIPPTITYDEETGEATITSVTGTTIHYEFDGTTPTGSSATYSAPVSMAGHNIIKAIAVDAQGITSNVVTLTLKDFTYHILYKDKTEAIRATKRQVVGKQLSESYTDIPAAIRSPYLDGETITFYNDADCAEEHKISETPSATSDIYVRYTTNLDGKFLHLQGARALNVMVNGDYISDSGTAGSGTFAHNPDATGDEKMTRPYLWYFSGNDPYAIEIRNAQTDNYIGYTTPSTLSLETEPTNKKFILMSGAAAGVYTGDVEHYEQMELMAATGDENYYRISRSGDAFSLSTTTTGDAIQVRAYPNSSAVTYYLIDQAGKILLTKNSKLDNVVVPDEWKSPMVGTYNYWKVGAFDIYGTGDNKVYKLKAAPESFRINTPTDVDDGMIYITYEVNDLITFDTFDDDTTHVGVPTYMLKFYGGENFLQENGKDGLDVSAQKAEYPYSNGDAMLYVYSDAKRVAQFSSGASTRPRWLWYAVSPQAAKVNTGSEEVDVTPGYKGDPYHVKIMSHSSQATSQNYFRTYVVNYGGSNHVVTGVTTKNENVDASHDNQLPTEYMILSAPNDKYKLVTVDEISDGTTTERRTVNTFEQYWKNNPTVQNKLGEAKVTASESTTDDGIELTPVQASLLSGWHTYKAWANAAPWVSWSNASGSGKQYHNKHHWFQTIDMGSTGEFTFEATTLEPEVILLDNHGWEIMRIPLSDAAKLKKYDSPMVETYHWYPTAAKVTGYHKYKVGAPEITVYYSYEEGGKTKWGNSGIPYTHTSKSLADTPYLHFAENGWEEQPDNVKTDFYVTYDVSPAYARYYSGAATEATATVTAFWVKQGDDYAYINESNHQLTTTTDPTTLQDVEVAEWYVKPNFDIDVEMGYQYDVEEDDGAGGTYTPNKTQKDTKNYEEGRNGFDPYNVQFQNVKNEYYYFKTNTTGSHLAGGWEGTSTNLSLQNLHGEGTTQENVDGNDQTKLSITNATFMVVKDESGHMLLMPRFDHTKVVNSFADPYLSAPNAATHTLELTMAPKVIYNSNEFAALNGQYTLASTFTFDEDFESLGTSEYPFTGSIDGGLHPISGLKKPLIAYAKNAIIKNVILDEVTVGNAEDVPNVGAIVANATGETRIYNCGINGGSVGGTGNVGGIVGNLLGEEITEDGKKKYVGARVINCYSYATITGGTNVGGIVGYNNYASNASNIRTMVMNCIFYGDITGGTTVSPVYGGENINNLNSGGLNTFNYYAYDELKSSPISKYNCALAIEEKNLKRFEFYRLLLNSNKKLAAYYASSAGDSVKADQIAKWVLETADRSIAEPKPYPILKAQDYYPSIINYDTRDLANYSEENRNKGLKTGELSVTINQGSDAPTGATITNGSLTLTRTDKDFDRFNFNYDKVQLPYYNDVGTGNYTGNKVVTGWKITAMSGEDLGTDPYSSSNYPTTGINDYPDHNYADRKSRNKDLYDVSKRVFSQGAYFDVPYGVTSITIEPYWGNAAYVADEYLDVVYNTGYTAQSVTQLGRQFGANKTSVKINGSDQIVYTSISEALKDTHLTDATVYDNAVVLVGNLHQGDVPSRGSKAFTIMSVDLNHDNEPDYSMIYHHDNRQQVCPIRFDFLNIPGTAQAQKPNGAELLKNFTIFLTKGWFETTNTCIVYSNQVEYENKQNSTTKVDAPLILLGGDFEQFVSTRAETVDGKTYYIHVGGNVKIDNFGLGTHSDGNKSTPHVPVSVTGGEFKGFYLTGTYNPNAAEREDNAECYISGGHFVEAAGACQEPIKGDVHWQIYNADIDAFYGGGINDARPIKGTITTDIYNSHVTLFCGGPKFGNMTADKAVTTNAEGCVFDEYFGAGYGGLSYSRQKYIDESGFKFGSNPYTTDKEKYFDGKTTNANNGYPGYGKKGPGVAIDFDYEFFVWSTGKTGARMYVKFASFSLAQCDNVFSNLKGCTVNHNFYGGGSLGKVVGKATSVLDGCTVHGNVFGGGYSGTLPTLEVRNSGFTKIPKFNSNSGMFEPGEFSGTTTYTWKNAEEAGVTLTNGGEGSDKTNHYIYTNQNLTVLGQVGETDLTIKGNTSVEGSVFGGGDESAITASATATGNTKVTIEENDTHETPTISNVYGGGNTADVEGKTEVKMTNGTVSQDIFGGGKGQTTVVGGNVEVNIGPKKNAEKPLSVRDVYGGSALGKVNTTADKTTTVNVYGGTVNGSVFGGGLGQKGVAEVAESGTPGEPGYVAPQAAIPAIVAENQGNTTVNVEGGWVKTAVYGGSNVNGVLTKDATVMLLGGTIGNSENQNRDVVFGGGYGAPTLVNGNVTVNVGKEGQTSAGAIIHGHLYGGGALGNTNEAWVTDTSTEPATTTLQPVANTKTLVNLLKGTINGYAYGGGLGDAETAAYVGGDVIVTLDGAKVQQVFGANNINGTPKGHVLVHVKRTTGGSAKDPSKTREQRTPTDPAYVYDVEAVYGGGNQADYVPTDASSGYAEVLIEGCELTSIDKVYGGGNAAAVPATKVTVKGSYIINTLYGGGNGAGDGNLGANVGYKSYSSLTPTDDEKTSKQYGTGKAETKLLGGYINDVYGGSNTRGDVRGGTDVRTKGKDEVVADCCESLNVGNIYGAGSHADVEGDAYIILECMPEDFVDAVYGGAKNATINGNVTLTVTSGKFGRVFGGNNEGGSINGSITVNVYEDGCEPLIIGELYGGGNAAPYSIYGCTQSGDTWTANESGDLHFDQEAKGRAAIQVNVVACTSVGKVFGGGMGTSAKVIGNTNVDVNLIKGIVNGIKQSTIGKVGQVFGGGGFAEVKGNTLVEVGTKLANEGEDEGVNIISGTDYLDPSDGSLDETITAGIYGGGYSADVDGNTTLNIGTKDQQIGEDPSVIIAGDIFGGGLGETTHVTGNVTVNIGADTGVAPAHNYVGYAQITGDVYGGSAKGTVNSKNNSTVNNYIPDSEHPETTANCYTKVNFYGGAITGNIYGGGEGQRPVAGPPAVEGIAANVFGPVTVTTLGGTVNKVFGCNNYFGAPQNTVDVYINGGTVNNSVYGGGNLAAYPAPGGSLDYPAVHINHGTVTENVFGGGYGLSAVVTGNPHITIGDGVEGHVVAIKKSVYGGGELAGVVGDTYIVMNSGTVGTTGEGGAKYGNIYGGGLGTEDTSKMTEAQAVQEAGIIKGNTNITVNGGTVLHNIYGGGANGSVGTFTYNGNNVITGYTSGGVANITILGGTIGTDGHENGMIFGASRGDVGKPGEIQDKLAWVYDTNVTIGNNTSANPQIKGSVYGSGENGHTYRNAAVAIHSGMVGITDVSIDGGAAYLYRGNVYGGGCGTDKYTGDDSNKHYNLTAGIVGGTTTVTIDGGHVVRNVYGGGAMGSVTGGTTVNIRGKSVIGADGSGGGYVYAASRGYDDMEAGFATVGSTTLNISGGTIWQSAFGGGQLGTVKGSVAVNVSGGVVKNDVYGGGALANTNTDNWNPEKENIFYDEVSFLTAGESVVTGLFTESSGVYTEVTVENTKAVADTKYYRKITGGWASDTNTSTTYTTTVTLTGGIMGNAYGGGLGDVNTPVYVFGDVTVKLNEDVSDPTKGAAFTRKTATNITVSGKNYPAIPITGSIFGCNNINGTPRGDVVVEVFSTRQLNAAETAVVSGHSPNGSNENYEVQAVYGGGNQADYQPLATKKTQVIIRGCDETSIEKVYGGGNSAAVPATDVTIWGTYDISDAFGGGNGSLPIRRGDVWIENAGSKVYGNTNVVCKGGKIGNVFGGSDAKGNVYGTMHTDVDHPEGGCALKITKIYGASKEADVDGDVSVIINGCSSDAIEYVCGGSYNANIRGDITLTITSGIFKNVYGGNDARGSIGGNITVNIQEEDSCKPIIIQNLVGGGFAADYPGEDSKNGGNAKRIKRDEDGKYISGQYDDFTRGKITVNVKSATRIDNIYGGGFRADVNGDTEVNINMIKGLWAGAQAPAGYSSLPNVHTKEFAKVLDLIVGTSSVTNYYEKSGSNYAKTSDVTAVSGKTYYAKVDTYVIDDAIGTIGNVYGGGNEGNVYGEAVVNIGTETEIPTMYRDGSGAFVTHKDVNNVQVIDTHNSTVLGAHITGNVFGGGNQAYVRDDATVNICAKKNGSGIYEAVSEGTEGVSISESVYGGGSAADVLGNTNVTMAGGYVYDGVYGGGLMGSVGTYTRDKTVKTESNGYDHSLHSATCVGKPTACTSGGNCTVVISGGQIGPLEVATKGMKNVGGTGPVDVGFVFGAGRGEVEDPDVDKDADFHTYVNNTDVTISGGIIMASVYGGGENGRVLGDTHVKIQGGQIGSGDTETVGGKTVPKVYTTDEWNGEDQSKFKECLSWDYRSPFLPHDPYAAAGDAEDAKVGTDGHTYYGSVFGGGSGYYPYKKADGTHEWLRSAGAVYGNTVIDITGGHILTCVYGGNETTDVGTYSINAKGQPLVHESGGKCTINMVGGTLGVPRTDEDAKKHPVTCYLFGAGKGDQRTHFNTWTNVQETVVNVSGTARIFGSVFGGGEDGHVLGNAKVNIGGEVKIDLNGDRDMDDSGETFTADSEKLKIGTTGTSYVDGNVFGGGRGFSGLALTAGSTGGNAEVNIAGGTMLGSIYGGGRLASVGIDFTPPTDPFYGQLVDDTNTQSHGHITINISGGTIGNDVANAKYGGNVFGGSMGRITLLDGSLNPIWPKQAVTKDTEITIIGNPVIKRNVYGGSEFGIVRDKAIVTIGGTRDKNTGVVTPSGTPTIHGSVYGGGYGSDDNTPTYITAGDYAPGADYVFTPMIWTGCVSGDTEVNIAGGTVKENVYGGGEVASVGLINCHVEEDENGDIIIKDENNVEKKYRYTKLTKHNDIQGTGANEKAYGFALSWPYKFEFISGDPRHPENIGGKATVNVTGGHIGSTTWNDGSGYVFGGSKGQVAFKKKVGNDLVNITDIHEQRYVEGLCANVKETEVNVNFATPSGKNSSNIGAETNCIMGAVYGGGEDGHVYNDAKVNITSGLIGLSVYGAGKGISTYQGYLRDESTKEYKNTKDDLYSWTAGKVYGNTTVTMTNGHVLNNIYGGGYLGSVGKGNYSGGADDYNPAGYGETLTGNLWDNVSDNSKAFLSSGKATVIIKGGTVGTLNGTYGNVGGSSDVTPSGMVFGGSRGQSAKDVMHDPRYEYAPNFYLGYVNDTEVTIGTESSGGPRIFSQVFGGGRDGHVRNSTHVIVNDGTIGQTYDETTGVAGSTADYQRYHRGNVYGSGSGLGQWESGKHGMSSGSVTNKTTVDINGGTIYNNVYGGGALSSVGPPRLNLEKDYAAATISQCVVNINGGTIGQTIPYETHKYGGCVYGASRGNDFAEGESEENFATVLWTKVNVNGGNIAGNVYGGAKGGLVWKDTEVHLKGGTIAHNAYGGGQGTSTIAANIGGNTTVTLNNNNDGGDADGSKKGCSVDKVFGCNDLNGTPKGHVLVHVYGTQNANPSQETMSDKTSLPPSYSANQASDEGYKAWLNRLITETTKSGGLAADNSVITDANDLLTSLSSTEEKDLSETAKTNITNAAKAIDDAMSALFDDYDYDVTAIYGGGDLAPYVPTVSEETTEVIIEGCNLTSIKQVYGGGNAAYAPATNVLVKSAYVIDELFGGGNGLDNYVKDGEWYENPGANVGYKQLAYYDTSGSHGTGADEANKYTAITYTDPDATTKAGRIAHYSIGTGVASTTVNGGFVHSVYGGSNKKGNIRREALLTVQQVGDCPLIIDKTYAGSKEAPIDAETNTVLDCVRQGGKFYGGSQNADILNDVHVRITNGHYAQVFGGNEKAGTITGSITIDIEENGCTPIVIDELYAGGYFAPYSVYGYAAVGEPAVDKDGNPIKDQNGNQLTQRRPLKKGESGALATPSRDPQINIISATKIGKIYGGGYAADLIGSPHINVNMTTGRIREKYADEYPKDPYGYITEEDAAGNKIIPVGVIGTIFGGGNKGDIYGDTYVEIGTGEWLNFNGKRETTDAEGKVYTYNSTTNKWDWTKTVGETTTSGTVDTKPAPARNAAFVLRESTGGQVYGGGDQGDVFGNTNVNIGNGYIYDRVYGGGNEGTVGTVSTRAALPTGHTSHEGCLGGKPTAFATGTGRTAVTVSGGYVGPFTYERSASTGVATPTPMTMPDDYGYVFGAGRGELTNPATDKDIDFRTYVDSTEVIISDSALIAGGVYGGSENGRVLRNTHLNIRGGQIGLGAGQTTAYAEADFIDPTTATAEQIAEKAALLPECAAWDYGKIYEGKTVKEWLPYDEHAGDANYPASIYGNASTTGSDGHTFYGNVFGGGSGYFAYAKGDGTYEWLPSAGLVEGDTYVNISGGHILTNVYGGNELTNVTGTAHVTMTGGTLGVPRTLAQIAAHPVTCYLFGGGKGDQRVHFNMSTNVKNVNVDVSGGIIYGSVFGGGEDGHVLGNVTMNISDGAKIGTWGTSYVDGNVFGGGRGFAGDALTAGVVCGNVDMNIKGGTMLGSIYGGGRLGSIGTHLEPSNHANYGKLIPDNRDEDYETGADYTHPGSTHGYVTINISGGTIGNKYEFIVPSGAGPVSGKDFGSWTDADWTSWKNTNHVPYTLYDTSNGRLTHTKGGNVFAGGMGRHTQLDGEKEITDVDWWKLGNVKSTTLTISGTPWIMSNVYGGGEMGAVNPYTSSGEPAVKEGGSTSITITGGTIGTEVTGETPEKTTVSWKPNSARSAVQYTFGSVYGGGMGLEVPASGDRHGGEVGGNTTVSMSGANTEVRASVFGGGEMAIVDGNATVTVSGGKIGRKEVMPLTDKTDPNAGYVLFGGATMGNVYGGGKGILGQTKAGLVKGNTTVNITGGEIYHMVYGGGALGSVGDFDISDGAGHPSYIPYAGIPYDWKYTDGTVINPATPNAEKTPTGTATVNITGGTIGISGRDNGLVFGSSRGGLAEPTGSPKMDSYDKLAWVNKSVVTIGTAGQGNDAPQPQIKGSVYGGGENGHNNESATVNVYSGTIGVTNTGDPYYNFDGNDAATAEAQIYRGNVYGAGSGTDTYKIDGIDFWNPKSGMVGGNTFVNIYGGHIGRSVYGGGAMASVGTIINANDTIQGGSAKHDSETTGFALSWPYKFEFAANTGKATVNVTGGHIGTRQLDGGDVYGSSRGLAGDRYKMAHLAWTNETEVNINYTSPYELGDNDTEETFQNDFTKQCITGSVHGSGENGYVYGDTHVTLNKGLIGHSLYGAGKGKGTYTKSLNKIAALVTTDNDPAESVTPPTQTETTYQADIYSLIAGRVMGNTYVTMNGGHVGRNVYGGGNMGSVGKGNYASGNDDYAYDSAIGKAQGYGEKIDGNLWTENPAANTDAWYFQNSGKATVKVLGGTVGYINTDNPKKSMKNELPYGNVFGGSAGEAAANIADDPSDLYLYSPAFFSGYVNETDVTIGTSGQETDANAGQTDKAPRILGSVYGGGQDGHVRRDAKVTVYSGEIGLPYTSDNQTLLKTDNLDSPQWMHRGNIYGGGSGITKYRYDFNHDGDYLDVVSYGPDAEHMVSTKEEDYSTSSGSVTRFTEVNVLGGIVHRNVYGGGSNGSVGAPKITQDYLPYKKGDTEEGHGVGKQSQNTVTIGGGSTVVTIGTPFNSTRGWSYNKTYGGEVYGACRGMSSLDPEKFANSVWTLVHVKNKSNIMGNVYGGGDSGIVKKDSEVKIGDPVTP